MKEAIMNWYRAHSAADLYKVGFTHDGALYAVTVKELPDSWLKLDRMSSKRGGFAKIRVRLSAAAKAELVSSGKAQRLGSADLLEGADRYNRGERFERLVTELAGQVWVKDSVPFWVAGDIRIDGLEVQIKLDGAELTNERCMARVGA